jgi:hypothetical protein
MMNPNEKRVFRIGLVLCVLACLVAAPLVFAATRPVVPVLSEDEPEPIRATISSGDVVLWRGTFVASRAVPEKQAPAKYRPAQAKPHRAVDCSNARVRQYETLTQGTGGVLYCHD